MYPMNHVGHRARASTGFTLIEVLVVIAIIAILAALGLKVSTGAQHRAAVDRTRAELAVLRTALEEYRRIYHDYPDATDAVGLLEALSGHGKRPPFVNLKAFRLSEDGQVLVDSWGHPYVYRPENSGGRLGYKLYSLGPDGQEGNHGEVDMDLDNVVGIH